MSELDQPDIGTHGVLDQEQVAADQVVGACVDEHRGRVGRQAKAEWAITSKLRNRPRSVDTSAARPAASRSVAVHGERHHSQARVAELGRSGLTSTEAASPDRHRGDTGRGSRATRTAALGRRKRGLRMVPIAGTRRDPKHVQRIVDAF